MLFVESACKQTAKFAILFSCRKFKRIRPTHIWPDTIWEKWKLQFLNMPVVTLSWGRTIRRLLTWSRTFQAWWGAILHTYRNAYDAHNFHSFQLELDENAIVVCANHHFIQQDSSSQTYHGGLPPHGAMHENYVRSWPGQDGGGEEVTRVPVPGTRDILQHLCEFAVVPKAHRHQGTE